MANVQEFKTAKSFKTAWDKSTAQPAVQAGSKLEVGEDTGIISDADAMKIKPTTKLTCVTTSHKESGTNRNKVVLK